MTAVAQLPAPSTATEETQKRHSGNSLIFWSGGLGGGAVWLSFFLISFVVLDSNNPSTRLDLHSLRATRLAMSEGGEAAESNGRHGQTRTADLLRVKQAL